MANQKAQSWHEDDPDVMVMPIYVSQSIGVVHLSPNGKGNAVEEAFRIIGQSGPADNSSHHSEYSFYLPEVGKFVVAVELEEEGH